MRLWTLHPRYLDTQGLLALWREALLAQKVLGGQTVGYRNHPQLARFKTLPDPAAAIATYLHFVHQEAAARGYRFNRDKIQGDVQAVRILSTQGQLLYEWEHLKHKLKQRDRVRYESLRAVTVPEAHPMFDLIPGGIEDWETGSRRI